MIPLPKVKNEPNQQYDIVKKYCSVPYWEEAYSDLFDPEIVVDFPHAPPGFYQHYAPFEFEAFRYWMRNIVSNWETVGDSTVIQTKDPGVLWGVYFCKCDIYLAKRPCRYQNEHAVRFTIKDGKIIHIRDYFNPISFYDAMGIVLPAFIFDPVDDCPSVRMPENGVSKFSVAQNVQRAVNNFANPIEVDGDPEPIYAANVLEVCPNAPYSMTEGYSGKSFDVQTEWMFRVVPEWNSDPRSGYYETIDPNVIVVESLGYGVTTWSQREGHYIQRELQIAFLDQGKVSHFRVYFNPLCKFNSMNQCIPTIPFFNF